MPCLARASMKASSLRLCYVVEILNANDLGDFLGFAELRGTDVAHADVTNQSLAFQFREHSNGFLDRAFDGSIIPPTRRLTTSSASRPRLRRLS